MLGGVAAHAEAWGRRWEVADVAVEGDDAAQQALRFAVYHLVSAANPEDERVSIGPRGLTGDAYLGHVFWDTEIFLLPFYTLTWPEAARALMMYRYHTLHAARAKAARLRYRGALYAWESADTATGHAGARGGPVGWSSHSVRTQEQQRRRRLRVWQYWRVPRTPPSCWTGRRDHARDSTLLGEPRSLRTMAASTSAWSSARRIPRVGGR